jgi:hypothetical protein
MLALLGRMADPRRDGKIERAYLLRRKIRLSSLLWAAFAAVVMLVGFVLGPADGAGRTFTYMLLALGLSMALVRHRRANLLAEDEPDLEIQPLGLVDNQTGAGLIPWPVITEIRLDQRRNRGAGNALLLLRLADPDRLTDRLRLGYRIASIGMWPRTGNYHWIDLSDLDCQPAALVASIEAAHGEAMASHAHQPAGEMG